MGFVPSSQHVREDILLLSLLCGVMQVSPLEPRRSLGMCSCFLYSSILLKEGIFFYGSLCFILPHGGTLAVVAFTLSLVFSSKDIVGILLCSSERVREIGCYWDPRTVICKFTRPDPTAVMRFVLGCKRGNWKQYPVYCVLQHTLMHCCLFALLRTCVAYLMCRRNTTANTTYEVLFGNKSG